MSLLKIVKYPDELLHKKSEEVKKFDKNLRKLIKNMFETMYENDGIGLAGVQVGVLKRILVIHIDTDDIQFKSEVINPKIISFSKDQSIMCEGCLSVVGEMYDVLRPNEVIVEFQKVDGKTYRVEAKGLLAKCFQHEIDHLNGITIVDRGTVNNKKNNKN